MIPMVMDQEEKERERQQKKEEEDRHLTEEIEKEAVSMDEINESKDRVHEHFKQISDIVPLDQQATSKKKKPTHMTLGKMRGRKRKRESSITKAHKKNQMDRNTEFVTPAPSLDTRIVHVPKKGKAAARQATEEYKAQQNLAQVQDANNPEIQSIR